MPSTAVHLLNIRASEEQKPAGDEDAMSSATISREHANIILNNVFLVDRLVLKSSPART